MQEDNFFFEVNFIAIRHLDTDRDAWYCMHVMDGDEDEELDTL